MTEVQAAPGADTRDPAAEREQFRRWHVTVTFTLDHETVTSGRWHHDAATGHVVDDDDRYTREVTEEEVIEYLDVLDGCDTQYVIDGVQEVAPESYPCPGPDCDDQADFVNEILERAPESYDGDEAAEDIAIRYVRDLERIRDDVRGDYPGSMQKLQQAYRLNGMPQGDEDGAATELANGITEGAGELEDPEDGQGYDPGPECDDQGGMTEYRYILPEDYTRTGGMTS